MRADIRIIQRRWREKAGQYLRTEHCSWCGKEEVGSGRLEAESSQKLKFTYKEQREFETIDDDIAALEELLEKLDKDMEANATNSVKLREIMEQKEKAQADLDEKMDRWVYLNDLAERIEAQKSEK